MKTATVIRYEDFLTKLPQAQDKGRYITGVCPFHHDNSPSLLVYKDGWFHCLAMDCSRSGTWASLWNELSGIKTYLQPEVRVHYKSPVRMLEEDYENREVGAYQAYINLSQFATFQWYLKMRGVDDAIDLQEIGYHRGWYTFPVRDRDYKFQNVVFRAAPHVQSAIDMRYWADGAPGMYVPDWNLLTKSDYILVVFGIIDALTLNKFRYPVVTPTHGHVFHADWLGSYRKPIYIIPDKGEEKAVLKMMPDFGWRGRMLRLDWPEGMKDANDFLKANRMSELEAQLSRFIR